MTRECCGVFPHFALVLLACSVLLSQCPARAWSEVFLQNFEFDRPETFQPDHLGISSQDAVAALLQRIRKELAVASQSSRHVPFLPLAHSRQQGLRSEIDSTDPDTAALYREHDTHASKSQPLQPSQEGDNRGEADSFRVRGGGRLAYLRRFFHSLTSRESPRAWHSTSPSFFRALSVHRYPFNISGTFRARWAAAPANESLMNLTSQNYFKQKTGVFLLNVVSQKTDQEHLHLLQGKLVVRDGFFNSERTLYQRSMIGLYCPFVGMAFLYSDTAQLIEDASVQAHDFNLSRDSIASSTKDATKKKDSESEVTPCRTALRLSMMPVLDKKDASDGKGTGNNGNEEKKEKKVHEKEVIEEPQLGFGGGFLASLFGSFIRLFAAPQKRVQLPSRHLVADEWSETGGEKPIGDSIEFREEREIEPLVERNAEELHEVPEERWDEDGQNGAAQPAHSAFTLWDLAPTEDSIGRDALEGEAVDALPEQPAADNPFTLNVEPSETTLDALAREAGIEDDARRRERKMMERLEEEEQQEEENHFRAQQNELFESQVADDKKQFREDEDGIRGTDQREEKQFDDENQFQDEIQSQDEKQSQDDYQYRYNSQYQLAEEEQSQSDDETRFREEQLANSELEKLTKKLQSDIYTKETLSSGRSYMEWEESRDESVHDPARSDGNNMREVKVNNNGDGVADLLGAETEPLMKASGTLWSSECALNLTFEAKAVPFAMFYSKAINYGFMVIGLSALQVGLLSRQLTFSGSPARADEVSLASVIMHALLDSYLCLFHLTMGLLVDSLYQVFVTTAFFEFVIFSLFELRFLIIVWKARRAEAFNRLSWTGIRNEFGALYTRYYAFLLLGLLVLYRLREFMAYIIFLIFSFWVPQIISNVRRDSARALLPVYIVGVSVVRLGIPLYVYGCPENFLGVAPQWLVCVGLTAWVGLQASVLLLQSRFGSRFFLPACVLPAKYDYHRLSQVELAEITIEANEEEGDPCPICYCAMDGRDPSSVMVTPCKHAFHTNCLSQWMEQKMECPTCRGLLPPV